LPPLTAISISQQILRGRIERKRFYDLLGRPLCGWMFRHVEVDDSPAIMRQYDENEQYFERRRWHDKEVDRDKVFQVQVENVRQVREGGFFPCGLYLSAVDFATSIPSLKSSATILGEPHLGLDRHIRLMSCRNSGAIFGRPVRPSRLSARQ